MRHKNPEKNYGVHGMEIRFVYKGPRGAIQFLIFTNWHLPKVQEEFDVQRPVTWDCAHLHCHPMGADVGYHSPKPMYETQEKIDDKCPYLDGKPCYCDGSGLAAQDLLKKFIQFGEKAVWKELISRYRSQFHSKKA